MVYRNQQQEMKRLQWIGMFGKFFAAVGVGRNPLELGSARESLRLVTGSI